MALFREALLVSCVCIALAAVDQLRDAAALVQQRASAVAAPKPPREQAGDEDESENNPEESTGGGLAPWESAVKGHTTEEKLANKLHEVATQDEVPEEGRGMMNRLVQSRNNVTKMFVNESQSELLELRDIFMSKMPDLHTVKEMEMKLKMEHIKDMVPMGMGHVFLNDVDHPARCGDVTSSLYCGMSYKMYGLNCSGWGGEKCLDSNSSCADITNAGICTQSLLKVNMSCAGWGGSSCLMHNADPKRITDEDICDNSELRLGIRSVGWGGLECLSNDTAHCTKIRRPGICNDAKARLGLDCMGWAGKRCLEPDDVECRRITARHICAHATERFGLACTWSSARQRCFDA